ncbi:MAG: carbonic anhydrase [Fimbriimonadaceae bacterium]|nr:carbonic anhydrase [Alphaproteobacteria bacterium]
MSFPERLQTGYRSFRRGRYKSERERFEVLGDSGQKPKILVIGCCDSRVAPELIFDASPGELFVVRNVANLVPPCEPNGDYHGTSSAVQFAVQGLGVKHIVVLGHGGCGGIKAFIDGTGAARGDTDFITKWISLIDRAASKLAREVRDHIEDMQLPLEHAAIRLSLTNLRSFPFIATLEKAGELELHGAWFSITDGRLHILDQATGDFHPVADDIT